MGWWSRKYLDKLLMKLSNSAKVFWTNQADKLDWEFEPI